MEKRWAKRGLIGLAVIIVGAVVSALFPVAWHAMSPLLAAASHQVEIFFKKPVKDLSAGDLILIVFVGVWLAGHVFVVKKK